MENASKAILIAGGVLIAIIVISIAMHIWGMGTDAFSSIEKDKSELLKLKEKYRRILYVRVFRIANLYFSLFVYSGLISQFSFYH